MASTEGFAASEEFWVNESAAPLLSRNHNFLNHGNFTEIANRVATWPDLCHALPIEEIGEGEKDIADLARIFRADAERTFKGEDCRKAMVKVLERVGRHLGDYHQGMGYICSFLSLYLPHDDVYRITMRMTSSVYLEGYFSGTPEPFGRDCMVFSRLLTIHFPEIANHLEEAGAVPEAYASKWFIGLCVHVLPYHALVEYWELVMKHGWIYLFNFALCLVKHVGDALLATPQSDVFTMFSILRLDPKLYPSESSESSDSADSESLFLSIVKDAESFGITEAEVESIRAEEWIKLQERLERVRQREKELAEDDDEIVFSDETSDDEDDE